MCPYERIVLMVGFLIHVVRSRLGSNLPEYIQSQRIGKNPRIIKRERELSCRNVTYTNITNYRICLLYTSDAADE